MLFNSYTFILLFLPVCIVLYYLLMRFSIKASKVALILSSLFFYAWWDTANLPIILASVVFNYYLGEYLKKKPTKAALIFGVFCNLLALAFFKYINFIITNLNDLTNSNLSLVAVVLPLAISFFTFQQIAYLVDCTKGKVNSNSKQDYLLFVTFFPQLIAGPIVHHKEIMSQFASISGQNVLQRIGKGFLIFAIGLFKKSFLADNFAVWADKGFSYSHSFSFFEAWFTSLSYTFQIYFDFSGYVDMATGCAIMLGIALPINFNSPYKSLNIQDFWRRWHITLGSFLRDYLYIPLGGSKGKSYQTYQNLLITFTLAGLWHGASWMFVLWGLLHAVALIAHRIWQSTNITMSKVLAWIITFNFINLTWVLFRADSVDLAFEVFRGMAGLNGIVFPLFLSGVLSNTALVVGDWLAALNGNIITVLSVLAVLIVCIVCPNSNALGRSWRPNFRYAVFSAALFVVGFASISKDSPFLYFNF